MKCPTLVRKYDLSEEMEYEYSSEEIREQESLRLVLTDTSYQTEREALPSLSPSPYSDSPGGVNSPLSVYFKTISRYPLLNEREERIVARRIKEREQECKKQIITWSKLLEDSVLKHCFLNQLSVISENYRTDEAFRFFDKVIMWEQERKKNRSYVKAARSEISH